MMSIDDPFDSPLIESRDTESRLAVLRFFSLSEFSNDDIDNRTNKTTSKGLIRPLSAPCFYSEFGDSVIRSRKNNPLPPSQSALMFAGSCERTSKSLLSSRFGDNLTTNKNIAGNGRCSFNPIPSSLTSVTHNRRCGATTTTTCTTTLVASPKRDIAVPLLQHLSKPSSVVFLQSQVEAITADYQKRPTPSNDTFVNNPNSTDTTKPFCYAKQQTTQDIGFIDSTISGVDLVKRGSIRKQQQQNHFVGKLRRAVVSKFPSTSNLYSVSKQRHISQHVGPSTDKYSTIVTQNGNTDLCNFGALNVQRYEKQSTMTTTSVGQNGGPSVENRLPQHETVPNRRMNGRGTEAHRPVLARPGSSSIIDDDANLSHNEVSLQQPTPLFERLVTEEVQELRAYVRIVENQNRRLKELEQVHVDLESRLESESKNRQQLETTLEAREREWAEKFEHIESDRDHWKHLVDVEKNKNSKLIDQVVRKDQDIHRMLQRKYDHEITRSTRNSRTSGSDLRDIGKSRGPSPGTTTSKSPDIRNDTAHKGPHQILAAAGSAEKVRNRNAKSLLMDFFGL